MKKILFFLIIISAFSVATYAQELQELSAGEQAKNDGNAAYKNKDYVGAIDNWEKYLNSGEEVVAADKNTKSLYVKTFKYAADDFMIKKKDYASGLSYYEKYIEKAGDKAKDNGEIIYKMAYCANKLDKNDVALSLFQKSIDLNYRPARCLLFIAKIYKEAGEEEKMIAILKDGLAKYPNNKSKSQMAQMLTTPMLKEAAVPFNEANELAKKASTDDPTEYLNNMAKAVAKFKEAIPLFEEVLKYDPKNNQAPTYINASKDNIKAFNEYQASLNK